MAEVKRATGRSYGGQSGDTRAAARRTALLDAAFALVADSGWRGLRIDAVCRAAGLNKRYFYESFADLDALVSALLGRLADDAIAVTLAAMEGRTPSARTVPVAIHAFIAQLTDDPRRARVLFGAVPAGDAAAAHRTAAIRSVVAVVASQGSDMHALDARAPVVGVAAALLVGGTSQVVLDWLDGDIAGDREWLAASLTALWEAVGERTATLSAGR